MIQYTVIRYNIVEYSMVKQTREESNRGVWRRANSKSRPEEWIRVVWNRIEQYKEEKRREGEKRLENNKQIRIEQNII